MKSLSITILALSLCVTSFSLADNHTSAKQQEMLKYIEFSQIGDPADVLEIKEERSRPLKSGEVRVGVLASPINPSDLLQISGRYGVDPVPAVKALAGY
jgi:trans-2-enoyl-CoA reductase